VPGDGPGGCMGTEMRARGGLPVEAGQCAPAAAACRGGVLGIDGGREGKRFHFSRRGMGESRSGE
jgi:hypothetical protein